MPAHSCPKCTRDGADGPTVLDYPAVSHSDYALRIGRYLLLLGHQHDCQPFLVYQFPKQGHQVVASCRIQCARGFVGQQHQRPGYQRPGDGDLLLLSAGQLGGPVCNPVR